MHNSDASIINRFLQTVAHLQGQPTPPVDKVIQRFGRPSVSQLTANGHDLAQATAMLRQAYLVH